MPVSRLAKWKTGIQMVAIGSIMLGGDGPFALPYAQIGNVLLWLAALLTLVTGYDYLRASLKHMSGEASVVPPAPAPPEGETDPPALSERKTAGAAR